MSNSALFHNRIILLNGDIDDDTANRITAELLLLTSHDPAAGIDLHLNSPGGSVSAGMAIHDTMELVEAPVSTWATGLTAGMAQVLLSAGAPGRRYALPQAKIVLTRISGAVNAKWQQEIMALNALATGQTAEQVVADSERQREFAAHEAVAYGLVDQVVNGGGGAAR